MTCEPLQPLLVAYVDGAASEAEQTHVEAHLRSCEACRHEVTVQHLVRQAMATHGRAAADLAPPGLRTRLSARLEAERTPELVGPGWRTRLSAFAAAAMVVLALGAVALPAVTGRSSVVLAAQLALDHLKCFAIDGHDHGESITAAEAQRELVREYGWQLEVPVNAGADDGRLVAVRRCLYGDGRAAHLLYRVGGAPVSLFILPGIERPSEEMTLLGHDEVVWTSSGHTYMLVGAAGSLDRLRQMASSLRNSAE